MEKKMGRMMVATGLAAVLLTACAARNQGARTVELPNASVQYNNNSYNVGVMLPPEFGRGDVTAFRLDAQNSSATPRTIIAVRDEKGNYVYGRIVTRMEDIDQKTSVAFGCKWGDVRYDPSTAILEVAVRELSGATTQMRMEECSPQEVNGVKPALNQAYHALPPDFRR